MFAKKFKTVAERSAEIKSTFINSIQELKKINEDAFAEIDINKQQIDNLESINKDLNNTIEINAKFQSKLEDLIS